MTELENLRKQKFILECKDHWDAKDWAFAAKLDRKILNLDPPKSKAKQAWFEVRQCIPLLYRGEYLCT